ncbi:MAG: hypothetical protein M1834_000276 [Cirrosporium novae-zelandiae]|nr:MAG: hypothetical protein M1834_000276 [Cirrosporium novae-zelandiae]
MAYLLYSVSFIALIIGTILYLSRSRWLPLLPVPNTIYQRIPNTFFDDVEAGLHSEDFNLAGNITSGDTRAGLDERGKREVQRIMKKKHVGFDEARRLYMEDGFKKNGIAADGLPKDPKFVSFS